MPQVPTYDGAQVRSTPLNTKNAYLGAEAFGAIAARDMAKAGEGIARAGAQLSDFAQKERDREDADAVFRAETNLRAQWKEQEQALRKRQGVDAKGLKAETEKWWDEAETRFTENLNERQKRLLAGSAVRLRQQSIDGVSQYEDAQLERSHDESWSASKFTSISEAAANPKPEVISATIQDLQKKNAYQAARKGWTADELAKNNLQDTTTLHTNVVRGLLSTPNGAKAAQDYFDQYKDQINGTLHDELKPAIQKGVVNQTAKEIATSLTGVPVEKALPQIGKIEDPEVRAEARQQYLLNQKDEELVRVSKERAASSRVWDAIAKGGRPAQADLDAMNPEERVKEVQAYFAAKAKAVASAGGKLHAKEDNYEALDQAEELIKRGDITDPRQLERYAPFLRAETFRTLRKSLEKRAEIPRGEVESVFFERLGTTKAKGLKDENTRQQWLAFQNYVNDNVKESKRPEDLEAWADKWFSKGYGTKDSIFTPDPSTYGEARTKGRDDFLLKTPESEKPRVMSTLEVVRKSGVKVPNSPTATDEFYTRFYQDGVRFFGARNAEATPARMAAYARVKGSGRPVTLEAINQELSMMANGTPPAKTPRGSTGQW